MNTVHETHEVRPLEDHELDLIQGAGMFEAVGVGLAYGWGGPVGMSAAATWGIARAAWDIWAIP